MKEQIQKLKNERDKIMDRVRKIDTAITSLQQVCNHKYEDGTSAMKCIGHDSHDDHYECQICGEMDYY